MCAEADTLAGVGVDELPNASPQDGANKDVNYSVENDRLSGMRPSCGDAMKSATSSSSSTSASALARRSATSFSSDI